LVIGVEVVSSQLIELKLKKRNEFDSKEEFSKSAAEKLYALRDIVTLTAFVERYYSKSMPSFRDKMTRRASRKGNGSIPVFSDNEVDEINNGIDDIVRNLNNIVSSL
jgi:hypothetical protein